jgi:predicted DNA-binding transcriptional regulator AlpA
MMQQSDRIISFHELQSYVPVSRTTVWRLMRANLFPASVQITARRRGWYISEILEWVAARSVGVKSSKVRSAGM